MTEGKLYRVLLPGIVQRSGDGWRRPNVGDSINIGDRGAAHLLAKGFVELAEPEHEKPHTSKRRKRDDIEPEDFTIAEEAE